MYQPQWMLAVQRPYAVYRQGQAANSKGLQWITLSTLSCPDTLFMFRSTGRFVPQVTPRVKKYLWSPFWSSYVYFSAKAHQSYTKSTKIKRKILKNISIMSYSFLKLRLNCSNDNETVVAFEKIIIWQTYLKKQGVFLS